MRDVRGLRRSLGLGSVVAFAVTNQIGAGLFFVSTQVQLAAPGVGDAVPWLMVLGGAITALIVAAYRLLLRDGAVGAGGEYTMLARTLGKRWAFCATFLSWFGITGALGALALTAVRFLESTARALGWSAFTAFLHAPLGTCLVGLALIWAVWGLHVRGVALAGRIAWVAGAFVVALALGTAVFAARLSPETVTAAAAAHVHRSAAAILAAVPPSLPLARACAAALPLLFFSYLGIATATQTGDETRDASRALPRALVVALGITTVVYVAFNVAIYHAVPWRLVAGLGALKETSATTTTGLLGFVLPSWGAAALGLATTFVVAKTAVPLFLAQSRWIYAWAADGMIPSWAARTAPRFGTPVVALTIGAACGSLTFLESVAFGFAFGVALRVLSAMLVLILVGIALMRGSRARRILGILLACVAAAFVVALVASALGAPFYAQPAFQALVVLAVALAMARVRGERTSDRG
jgi:amino acid transporter